MLPLQDRFAVFFLFLQPAEGSVVIRTKTNLLDVSSAQSRFAPVFCLTAIYVLGDARVNNFIALLEMVFVCVSIRWHNCPPQKIWLTHMLSAQT